MARSAEDVMRSHLRLRRDGELDRDLEENYHPEVVVMSAKGVYRGHDGVRESAHLLAQAIDDPDAYAYESVLVDDRFGLLEWRAKTDELNVHCGMDSYLIEDGLIVGQTIHYRVENVELSVSSEALSAPGEVGPTNEGDENRMAELVDDSG